MRRPWLLELVFVLGILLNPEPASAQEATCAQYDSQIWAQSVYESDPVRFAGLDPDGNGLACEEVAPGAAPAWWTTEVPAAAKPASLVRVTGGDTIRTVVNGVEEPVRLILIDTLETNDPHNPPECYGQDATAYLSWLLSLGGTLYLERDVSDRDHLDQLLRYAWLDFGEGEVYLVNEVVARSGYAAQSTDPPDVKYEEQIREAARFAREHGYGLWSGCGTDAAGETNERSAPPTAPPVPEPEPVAEEPTVTTPVPPVSEPDFVIISDPPEAFGCEPASTDGCTPVAP